MDSRGDNVLAEFSSVVDAVECAVEIQKELNQKIEKYPETVGRNFGLVST